MHRCLQIPEMLNIIFKLMHDEPAGRTAVATLARTARCFYDAALDRLWQTQSNFVPLIKCFPPELLEEARDADGTSTVKFLKDPKPEDWTRVVAYAARIRTLHLDLHGHVSTLQLDGSVYVTLKRCVGTEPLFPNLCSFKWTQMLHDAPQDVASFLLLLNPKVSSMTVVMNEYHWSEDSAKQVASALSTFGQNPAQLREVHFVCPSCHQIEEAVLALGFRQRHLQVFHYSWGNHMSFATVSHLSQLNNLQEVSIRPDQSTSKEIFLWAQDRIGHFFPSLKMLSLHTESLAVCIDWLNTIRHIGLVSLTLTVDDPATATTLQAFFTWLLHHPVNKTLRKLRYTSTTVATRNSSSHIIFAETLSPVLQLKLSVFKFDPGAPIEIDDEFVERIARAWPDLQLLELNSEWRRYPPLELLPRVTLMGLIPLAQHCPYVTTLGLPISTDVSAFEDTYETGNRPTGGVSFKQCYVVGVGASPLPDQANHLVIAGFLSDLCPDVVSLQTAWTMGSRETIGPELDAEDEQIGEDWRTIEMYTIEMARVRRQERLWIEEKQ